MERVSRMKFEKRKNLKKKKKKNKQKNILTLSGYTIDIKMFGMFLFIDGYCFNAVIK